MFSRKIVHSGRTSTTTNTCLEHSTPMSIETNETEIQETVRLIRTHPTASCCRATKAIAKSMQIEHN